MGKTCFCCGKEVKFLDLDLQNGKICDECYQKALKYDGRLSYFNISKYSGEEILAMIRQDEEALSHPENFAPHESKADKMIAAGEKATSSFYKWALIIAAVLLIIIFISSCLE